MIFHQLEVLLAPESYDVAPLALFAGLMFIVWLASYVYTSFAYMTLAHKTRTEPVWLSWVPLVGKPLVASKIAHMPYWPVIVGVVGWFVVALSLIWIEVLGPFAALTLMLGFAALMFLSVMFYVWQWKVFEAVDKPGWWVLLSFIPYVGPIIFFVLLGVAAWETPLNHSHARPRKSPLHATQASTRPVTHAVTTPRKKKTVTQTRKTAKKKNSRTRR